jgi:SH3-like domain-containing protein
MTATLRAAALLAFAAVLPAAAQTPAADPAAAAAPSAVPAPRLGPETNLPLPRYVSLNVEEANIRRGPGVAHRVDWVFRRRGLPLEVVAEHGHWRKVRDVDDAGGWIHHSLLRGFRTAVVVATPDAPLRAEPAPDASPVARAEAGVVGRLEECGAIWCRFEVEGRRGWVQKADLWGVGADEVFD